MIAGQAVKAVEAFTSGIRARRWRDITGRWRFEKSAIKYLGHESEPADLHRRPGSQLGLALSDGSLRRGRAETTVILPETSQGEGENTSVSAGILFGYQSEDSPYYFAAIGGFDHGIAIGRFEPSLGWTKIAAAGSLQNYSRRKPIQLIINLSAQVIDVSVGGVTLIRRCVLPSPLAGDGIGLYAWGSGTVEFRNTEAIGAPPKLFVIMPFREPFDTLYDSVIEPVGRKFAYVKRADQLVGPGKVVDDMQSEIEQATAVIAEISTGNPNVYYELGYSHALKKPAILLVKQEDVASLPFDIRPYRALVYHDTIGGKSRIERELQNHLEAVLGPPLEDRIEDIENEVDDA